MQGFQRPIHHTITFGILNVFHTFSSAKNSKTPLKGFKWGSLFLLGAQAPRNAASDGSFHAILKTSLSQTFRRRMGFLRNQYDFKALFFGETTITASWPVFK